MYSASQLDTDMTKILLIPLLSSATDLCWTDVESESPTADKLSERGW